MFDVMPSFCEPLLTPTYCKNTSTTPGPDVVASSPDTAQATASAAATAISGLVRMLVLIRLAVSFGRLPEHPCPEHPHRPA